VSNSPAITRSATTMPAVCDGEAKKTASAARTSKAPIVSTAHREFLFNGVSRPNRYAAAGSCRWLLDRVTRSSRRSTPAAEGRSTRSSRSRNAKSFTVSAIASANTRWVVVFTTVLTTRRGAPAPRRVATREASKLHPAEGVDRASATCRVPPRRFFDFQCRGTPLARS